MNTKIKLVDPLGNTEQIVYPKRFPIEYSAEDNTVYIHCDHNFLMLSRAIQEIEGDGDI